jgi:hypothetical protein
VRRAREHATPTGSPANHQGGLRAGRTDRSSSRRSCKRRPHRRLFGIHSAEWRSSPATADEEAQCASHTIIPKESQAALHLPIPHLDIVNPVRVSEVNLEQSHSRFVSPKCQSRVSTMTCHKSWLTHLPPWGRITARRVRARAFVEDARSNAIDREIRSCTGMSSVAYMTCRELRICRELHGTTHCL